MKSNVDVRVVMLNEQEVREAIIEYINRQGELELNPNDEAVSVICWPDQSSIGHKCANSCRMTVGWLANSKSEIITRVDFRT